MLGQWLSPSPPAPLSTPAAKNTNILILNISLRCQINWFNKAVLLVPSSQPTLSSFSHFSSSCLRPCCRTGLHSSRDSNLLSWPWSKRIPKYCKSGEAWPGWAGTLWNLRMVSAVRRIPWGWDVKMDELWIKEKQINYYWIFWVFYFYIVLHL